MNECGQAATYPEHSCYDWNVQHYCSSPEYLSSECGVCGRITGFMWRKWWRRLFSLFSSEPVRRSEVWIVARRELKWKMGRP